MAFEQGFKALVYKALKCEYRQTRNAVTQSFFGHHLVVDDLEKGNFPLLLGRQLFYKGVIGEMAAFLKGPKTLEDFKSQGCNYWDEWGDKDGNVNVDYGNAWRDFNGVDQLQDVVNSLREDPNGRRHLISGWRPDKIPDLDLPCCHYSYQWYVTNDGHLEMLWNQRSVDIMIGLPSDVILAAIWTILIANELGLKPGKLHFMLGDCHIYKSHLEGVKTYLTQSKTSEFRPKPSWVLLPEATVFNFEPPMIEIVNYHPKPKISFKLEV